MFWENYVRLCNKINSKPNPIAKKLGISSGTVTNWKKGTMPQSGQLQKIADFFNVSIDYLLEKEKTPEETSNAIILENQRIRMIPLFETVSAGFGAYPDDHIIDYVPLFINSEAEAKETICIKVQGDSMYPKIENRDTIQVHKQSSVDSGTIAVILLDGEDALVKKIVYGDSWIELHSINPMYKTMRYEGKDVERIKILGAVRKIIKEV